MRDQVFISYSHKDQRWLEKLTMMLAPFIRQERIVVWEDTKITPGALWEEEIKQALGRAKVAVLLVSPDLLASQFIMDHELPPLLEAAEKEGLTILWVAVRHSLYEATEIARYQAANNPSKPLSSLKRSEQERTLMQICQKLIAAADRPTSNERPHSETVSTESVDNNLDNLPVPRTPLIGRDQVIKEVRQLLLEGVSPLVTLIGPGGSGKTHLSLQIAEELCFNFQNGCFFVPLSSIQDPTLVISAIAQSLEVKQIGKQTLFEALVAYLRHKRMLLVLDNFEHVLDAACEIRTLLEQARELKVLVTSQARLGIGGEQIFPVEPLALNDAKMLFAQRAKAATGNFTLSETNAAAVTEICRQLDRLPLPIELAAARCNIFEPQEILERLKKHLLKFLTYDMKDLDPRHRRLRATLDWSYALLSEPEQILFRRLAVFSGSYSLAAVEAVCDTGIEQELDIIEVMGSLVDKSLLKKAEAVNGKARFMMLTTIQAYALEQLQQDEEYLLREAHATYYLHVAESAEQAWRIVQRRVWLEQMEAKQDNLRAALQWSLDHDYETAARMGGALAFWWESAGYLTEGRDWLKKALAKSSSVSISAEAKVLSSIGRLASDQCDYPEAQDMLSKSLALYQQAGDKAGMAAVLHQLGGVKRQLLENEQEASRYYEQSLKLYRQLDDKLGIAELLHLLGTVKRNQEVYDEARALFEESLQRYEQLDKPERRAWLYHDMAEMAQLQDTYDQAMILYDKSLKLFQEQRESIGIAWSLHNQAYVVNEQGNHEQAITYFREQAITYFRESLVLFQKLGPKDGIIACLAGIARIVGEGGQGIDAARLLGAVEHLCQPFNNHLRPIYNREYNRTLALVRNQVGEVEFKAALREGCAMTEDQAIAYALQQDVQS